MTDINNAVYVRNAYKHYGPKSGPNHKQVLDGLCMEVKRGSIYGLLGASGCGKTTLLSCIVGRKRFSSGELCVLGGSPGSEGSGVPGPRIGYMPQETALVGEFSIRGVVNYFGRIVGMTNEEMDARWFELRDLLDLPPDSQRVSECSGGQQRRVSLACALVHEPELLILDEPTVGVDPVLRENIWKHLVEIATQKNVSILITTHYIEECRNAHRIGLMRGGRLMAEESPTELVSRFRAETLEEVFLNLSIRQTEGMPNETGMNGNTALPIESGSVQTLVSDSVSDVSVTGMIGSTDLLTHKPKKEKRIKASPFSINRNRLNALFYKNWYQYFTNTAGVLFMVLFPLLHVTVFFLAVGADPKDIPVAFVNDENGTCTGFNFNDTLVFVNETDCEFKQMSCRFIKEIDDNDPMIRKIHYGDLYTAQDAVRSGTVAGVVYFGTNFSRATIDRIQEGRFATELSLDMSEIKVWLDMSNRQIGPTIGYRLLKKYVDFSKKMLEECGRNPQLSETPVRVHDAIYGSKDDSFTIFMVPGLLITVVYFLAAMMTSTVVISDRLEGVWDRTLVAGATAMEMLTAHFVIQFLMIVIQTVEVVLVSFLFFKVDYVGHVIDIVGLLLCQGIAGMTYGFMISALCTSHMMANFIATGSFYPMILICGNVWPVEAMPTYLRYISRMMPFTVPIEALRSIIAKGWTITDTQIIQSYGITGTWTLLYIVLTYYLLKMKM